MRVNLQCVLAALVALGLGTGTAIAGTENSTFYQKEREGWHFYEDPPRDEEPEQRPKEPEEPKTAEAKPAPKKKTQGPKPMSVQWIKKNIKTASAAPAQ